MGKETKSIAIPHKYNVGDEITVKIAKIESVGSKPAYRLKGIENIKISEAAIEKMLQKQTKPGDIIYGVVVDDEIQICFDAYMVEDIGYTGVKVSGDWMPIDESIFFDEESAERKAIELAQEHGLPITKGGLFKQEVSDGRD